MRTRNKGLHHYGIDNETEHRLLEFCRTATSPACEEVSRELLNITHRVNESIWSELYISLLWGLSYDKLTIYRSINYSKNDFYGYRRKCIAELNKFMEVWNK